MDKTTNEACDCVPIKQPAYDPNNLHPLDAACREFDEKIDGVDWDEIIATTQDDFLAGRFAFNTADYPTEEAGMAAMRQWFVDLAREILGEEAAAALSLDGPR